MEQFHADNKVFRIVQEVWIDENSVFCDPRASRKRLEDIPGGFQDAPGRSGTLLEASGTLLDAVGRSWKLPLESRTAREGPNTTPVVCFVAPGCLQDAPGRSNITPVVFFWDGEGPKCWQQPARRTPPKRIFSPFFHYLMNSHSENIFSVSYILHILTYSYVLSILITEYIQTDWFGFIHKTVYTPRGTRPRRI